MSNCDQEARNGTHERKDDTDSAAGRKPPRSARIGFLGRTTLLVPEARLLGCDTAGTASGWPHLGQAAAESLTCCPHSGHGISIPLARRRPLFCAGCSLRRGR